MMHHTNLRIFVKLYRHTESLPILGLFTNISVTLLVLERGNHWCCR